MFEKLKRFFGDLVRLTVEALNPRQPVPIKVKVDRR